MYYVSGFCCLNLLLGVVCVTQLLGAVPRFRQSKFQGPAWSMSTGTCAHAYVPGWSPTIALKLVLGSGSTRAPMFMLMFLVDLPLSLKAPLLALLLLTTSVKGGGLGCPKNGLTLVVTRSRIFFLCLWRFFVVPLLLTLAPGCCRLLLLLLPSEPLPALRIGPCPLLWIGLLLGLEVAELWVADLISAQIVPFVRVTLLCLRRVPSCSALAGPLCRRCLTPLPLCSRACARVPKLSWAD